MAIEPSAGSGSCCRGSWPMSSTNSRWVLPRWISSLGDSSHSVSTAEPLRRVPVRLPRSRSRQPPAGEKPPARSRLPRSASTVRGLVRICCIVAPAGRLANGSFFRLEPFDLQIIAQRVLKGALLGRPLDTLVGAEDAVPDVEGNPEVVLPHVVVVVQVVYRP